MRKVLSTYCFLLCTLLLGQSHLSGLQYQDYHEFSTSELLSQAAEDGILTPLHSDVHLRANESVPENEDDSNAFLLVENEEEEDDKHSPGKKLFSPFVADHSNIFPPVLEYLTKGLTKGKSSHVPAFSRYLRFEVFRI